MREIWKQLPSSLIKNCGDGTGFLSFDAVASRKVAIDNLVNRSEENQLESQIMSLVPTRERMSVRELVHPDGENESLQQVAGCGIIPLRPGLGERRRL